MRDIVAKLSSQSVAEAIEQLKNASESLEDNLRDGLRAVAGLVQEAAKEVYGRSVDVRVDPIPDGIGYEITAEGEAVGFIEFGAGAFADSQHPYANEVPYPVFPGSYSDTVGAGTYMWWVTLYGSDEKYPFNRVPKRALYNAMQIGRAAVLDKVKERFDD